VKKVIIAMIVLGLFPITSSPAQAAQCKDGTYSSSTGRGTCSGHGGVASWGNAPAQSISKAAVEANLKRQQEIAKAALIKAAADKAIKAKADSAAKLLGFKNAADQAQAEKIAEDKRIAAEKAEQQLIETELEIARLKAEAEAEVLRIQNAKILEDKLNAEKIAAQTKVQNAIYAEKMEKENKRLNPNNPRQYVMPYSNFTLCDQYGGQYRSANACVGFLVCEQQLVNSGYTIPSGSNSRSSLEQWLRMGQLVQTPDNPSCASIKGSPIAPKGR
jgi:hypothetical protein